MSRDEDLPPEIRRLLWNGQLSQTCPSCGFIQPAADFCSRCHATTGPETWQRASENKPTTCSLCGKTFPTPVKALQHQNNHRGPDSDVDPLTEAKALRKAASAGRRRMRELEKTDPDWLRHKAEAMSAWSRRYWDDPEHRQRQSERRQKHVADPKVRQQIAETTRRQWADPKKGKAIRDATQSPEARQRSSETTRKRMAKPAARRKASKTMSQQWNDPEGKAKLLAGRAVANARPERKRQLSEISTKRWADPEWKANQRATIAAGIARAKAEREP